MLSQVVACVTVGGAVLLAVSGLTHTFRYRRLLASLLVHDVLPYRFARLTARTVPAIQLLLGCAFLVASLVPSSVPALVVFTGIGAGLMYVGLAGYVLAVLFSVEEPTCACFGRSERVSWFSIVRTALPAVGFAYAVLWPSQVLATSLGLSVVGGLALAMLGMLGQKAKRPQGDLTQEPADSTRSG